MDKIFNIIFECMIAISVILCFLYITMSLKKTRENGNKPNGAVLSKKSVELEYDGNRSAAIVTFYTDGLLFEKDGGNTLFVSEKKIVRIAKKDVNCYTVEFMPSVLQSDKFEIYSEQDIDEDIANIVNGKKLSF